MISPLRAQSKRQRHQEDIEHHGTTPRAAPPKTHLLQHEETPEHRSPGAQAVLPQLKVCKTQAWEVSPTWILCGPTFLFTVSLLFTLVILLNLGHFTEP